MFTGIVEEAAIIEKIKPTGKAIELTVRANVCGRGLKIGASVAVNGCCLTATKISARGKSKLIQFDLLQESWRLTNLQFTRPGSLVNLERSLRVGGELGGHFVTGHVDGVGKIALWEKSGADHLLEIAAPPSMLHQMILKGSIAIDGISLTVARVDQKTFQVWIIPHTLAVTALRERKAGEAVNLETDMLGKYVDRFLGLRGQR